MRLLHGEARQTASILHQTPGWRWRRELCMTQRSQQCQSGPTTKAWFHDRGNRVDRRLPARHRHDACETPSEHLRRAVPKLEKRLPARQRWTHARHRPVAPPERDPRRSGQHCFKELWKTTPRDKRAALEARRLLRQSQCGWHRQTASSGRVRKAPLKLDRPIVRVLPVHNDGGVSRYRV